MDWNRTVDLKTAVIWVVRGCILGVSFAFFILAIGHMHKYLYEVDPDVILSYSTDPNNPETYIRGVPFTAVLNSLIWGGLLAIVERVVNIIEQARVGEKKVYKENLRIRMLYE